MARSVFSELTSEGGMSFNMDALDSYQNAV